MVADGAASDGTADAEVHEELMAATYRAVCARGFADLTMRDIADEAGKSTALLHYHYDTKQGLLVAFLEHLLGRFAERVAGMETDDPEERLAGLLDVLCSGGGESTDTAFLELWAQAPYEEPYREQLARNEAFVRERVAAAVADGVADGSFRAVDPDRFARLVTAAVDGARLKRAALGRSDEPAAVREAVTEHLLADLRATDDPGPDGPRTADRPPGDSHATDDRPGDAAPGAGDCCPEGGG